MWVSIDFYFKLSTAITPTEGILSKEHIINISGTCFAAM
jgi:hypothetical protein